MTSQYELFKEFAKSFTLYQSRWVNLFKGKLLIEERHNPIIKDIQSNLSTFHTKKEKVMYALNLYMGDKNFPHDIEESIKEIDDPSAIISTLINCFGNGYQAGKIALILRHDSAFSQIKKDVHVMTSIAGSGGIDGANLLVGEKKQYNESYFYIVSIMIDLEKDEFISYLFKNDYLLLEDYLCEFHMFYRLFLPKYKDITPLQCIEYVNQNKIESITLSDYISSDLPYDQFQKQCITNIIYKGDTI
jgi:hypothetical protein